MSWLKRLFTWVAPNSKSFKNELSAQVRVFDNMLRKFDTQSSKLKRLERDFKRLWDKNKGSFVLMPADLHRLEQIERESITAFDNMAESLKQLDAAGIEVVGDIIRYADAVRGRENDKEANEFNRAVARQGDAFQDMMRSELWKTKQELAEDRKKRRVA
ncbi:hypothetical protein HN587_01260 [Candidatus Woesearchaeota archaeon]|jgi:hypothetical protein|nr:hypothetical protein [Candidatus Woesearchaeota archaeon]